MAEATPRGRLLLVPAPLDFGCEPQAPIVDVLPQGTLVEAARLTHWIVENAKTARGVIKRIGEAVPLAAPLQQHLITELPRELHKKGDTGEGADLRALLAPALQGHDIGLMSEAGMPAVADPGNTVVRSAHALGLTVQPLVGPVSLLLALAASGLNGQHFAYVGYLPQDAAERAKRLRELESLATRQGQTQLFIETPYRNAALWGALMQGLQPTTRVAVASGLTLPDARCESATVAQWRQREAPVGKDRPAVFLIGR